MGDWRCARAEAVGGLVVFDERGGEGEKLTSSGAFAHRGDVGRVAAEAGDVVLDPLESGGLVAEAVVGLVASLPHLGGGEEARDTQAVPVLHQKTDPTKGFRAWKFVRTHPIFTPMNGLPVSAPNLTSRLKSYCGHQLAPMNNPPP